MKYFYTKYIVVETLIEELHLLDLSREQRYHLATLVDSQIHSAVLDEILSNLSPEDKKAFLFKVSQNPDDEKLMEFLNSKIEKIDEKIKKVAEDLVKELHEDIKEAKKVK